MSRNVQPQTRVDIGELLSRELGANQVIRPDNDRLEDYGRDESYCGYFPPDCAVLCQNTEQVSTVLRLAAEHGVPVTPRGAGSGMTGGCLPVRGGVVLSVETMTNIREIDPRDLVVVTEPGVITGELQTAVEEEGLFYPPDPASLAYCSIGGNVASNAGGPRAFKYGVTRQYVLGMEVVLMGGEILRVGRRTSKGVTGYDLSSGFIGTEGTFGVVTDITLKVLPKPAGVVTLLTIYPDMAAAAGAVDALLHKGIVPRTIEIADKNSIDHVRKKASYRFPKDAGAIVLIELDGEQESLEPAMFKVGEICEQAGAIDIMVAQDSKERRNMWEARRLISPSLKEAHKHKINEDICVPRGAIPEMLRRVEALKQSTGLDFATFGHAGDGNLHVNMLVDDDINDPMVAKHVDGALTRLFEETVALRGTLSGEHGIGLAKQKFMPIEQSEQVMEWQRKWKRMWDPSELLNPGKILPARPRRCHE